VKNFKGILPGMFTMGNLACGFASIITSAKALDTPGGLSNNNLFEAVWLIVLAAFFDFLDGLVARFTKGYSRFGVELDSLTDVVSFGVAPAVLLVSFGLIKHGNWAWILGFVFLMAATFRLARFNLSATLEKKANFLGLPVPSAAIVIISYILFSYEIWGEIRMEKFFIIVILATAALMVSTVEFEAMPRFDFSKPTNRIKVILLIAAAIGIMINASLVIFPLGLLYILYGIGKLLFALLFGKKEKYRQRSPKTAKGGKEES
jgi:CDP-diacylglycerol---serine O-phosphatidyltransferase